MIEHAGYQTIDLQTFVDFVQGDPVELPPRPLLLTFDDARANSWTGGDGILQEARLQRGHVRRRRPRRGRQPGVPDLGRAPGHAGERPLGVQLHAGPTAINRSSTARARTTTGPYYAYVEQDEDFDEWQKRVRSDIDWGQDTLADHIPGYRPLAFSPPYGNYGQDGTNDPRIPSDLLGWLTRRYGAVFTQDGTHGRTEAADSRSAGSRSREKRPAASSTPSCCRVAPRRLPNHRATRRPLLSS